MTGCRLLVAGDKSHAGKSTVAMGLLASLLEAGYAPSELAYIKPATQCVSSTLTARFCEEAGIAYRHIGPLVFYRGYTREVLDQRINSAADGKAADAGSEAEGKESSAELVRRCANAVDAISKGKRLTVIDGVGYPSVGSIVGCSSADLAIACRAPVLLVGKGGVGDAVDSFNLNARFFEAQRIPVLGAIFNRLPPSGFYGIQSCEKYITAYMASERPRQRVYGLLPSDESLAALESEESCSFSYRAPEEPKSAGALSDADRKAVENVKLLFRKHINTRALANDLQEAGAHPERWTQRLLTFPGCD